MCTRVKGASQGSQKNAEMCARNMQKIARIFEKLMRKTCTNLGEKARLQKKSTHATKTHGMKHAKTWKVSKKSY